MKKILLTLIIILLCTGTARATYNILPSGDTAQTVGMQRTLTANTSGNNLTIQSGGATSGATNAAGGLLLLQTGLGTGNSTPTEIRILALAQGTASGATDQTLVNRVVLNGTVQLANTAASTILTIPLATVQMASGYVFYSMEASDGTDAIAEGGFFNFAAVNKAGNYTTTAIFPTSTVVKTDGTDNLSVSFTFSNGSNQTAIQANPTLTGMTATTFRMTYTLISGCQQNITAP